MADIKYKRVVLKLSGEALAGEAGHGIDPPEIRKVAEEIKEVRRSRSRNRNRCRRRQHVARRSRRSDGHGTCASRLHRHARHGDERVGIAG